MSRRQVLHIDGLGHGSAPIPSAVRIGNMIFTSGVQGKDPETGELPDDTASQVRFAFSNMVALLREGGAGPEDVAKVTVFLKDRQDRKLVNPVWTELFPDPEDRPARHAIELDLAGGMRVQLEVIAVLPE